MSVRCFSWVCNTLIRLILNWFRFKLCWLDYVDIQLIGLGLESICLVTLNCVEFFLYWVELNWVHIDLRCIYIALIGLALIWFGLCWRWVNWVGLGLQCVEWIAFTLQTLELNWHWVHWVNLTCGKLDWVYTKLLRFSLLWVRLFLYSVEF